MFQVNKINGALTLINDVNGVKERYAINFRGSVHDRAIAVRDVTLVPASELPAVLAHIAQLEEAYRASAGPLDAIFAAGANVSDDERSALEGLKAAERKAVPLLHDAIDKQQAGATGAAKDEVLELARPAFIEWLAACNRLINMEEGLNHVQATMARRVGVEFQYLTLILTLIATALGITIALMTSRSISRILGGEPGDVKRITDAIGEGDLASPLHLRDGDTDSILASLSRMQGALRSTIQEVTETATNASYTSQEIAAASESIATGAQKQAASLETTSASLEEITATMRQSADNARQASQIASSSRESAEKGQGAVTSAISAMEEINVASAKISDIISTIDEIAFQTNLLAVNAAVEAARAGEQGRGFAVVASEVRSLAQRSAGAAREIKTLIQDSLRKVERGSELVNRSGETLLSIVGSVKKVTDIVGEIAAAAEEQSIGVDQVNTAITQIDQVTQQNSAQTEELSSTAQVLSDQSARLLKLVSVFTFGQESREPMASLEPARTSRRPAQPPARGIRRPGTAARKPERADLRAPGSRPKVPAALLTARSPAAPPESSFEEF
jgi:methyl-accepting chemotaxis protein